MAETPKDGIYGPTLGAVDSASSLGKNENAWDHAAVVLLARNADAIIAGQSLELERLRAGLSTMKEAMANTSNRSGAEVEDLILQTLEELLIPTAPGGEIQ